MKVIFLWESQLKTATKRDLLPSTIYRRCICLVFVYTLLYTHSLFCARVDVHHTVSYRIFSIHETPIHSKATETYVEKGLVTQLCWFFFCRFFACVLGWIVAVEISVLFRVICDFLIATVSVNVHVCLFPSGGNSLFRRLHSMIVQSCWKCLDITPNIRFTLTRLTNSSQVNKHNCTLQVRLQFTCTSHAPWSPFELASCCSLCS